MTSSDVTAGLAHSRVDYDPFDGGGLERVVPTTESQQEIWLADQLHRDASLAFNLSVSLRLRGQLDVESLRGAIHDLIDRHDALRATVAPDGETFCLIERVEVPMPFIDLKAMGEVARNAAIQERVRLSVETPFDLSREPLFRAELLCLDADEHLLLLSSHHIVCDGWSWWVVIRELGALYGKRRGLACPPLPPPGSFGAYALAEDGRKADAEFATDEAYWMSRFSDETPVLELPTDRPRQAQRSFASAREDHVLDVVLLNEIKRMGARRGVGLFATLLAGFSVLLSRISGQRGIVVGISAAGQAVNGHDSLIGHCVNLLPLRFDVDPSQLFTGAMIEAQATLLDALEHQRYTFGTLLKKLRVRRDPARMPLVSVLFNIDQAIDRESTAFPGMEMEFGVNPRHFDAFELSVNAVQSQGQLRIECQYNRDLFDAATVRRWLRAYETLLRAATERENAVISRLPLVDAVAESELFALQPDPVSFDPQCRMHEHFEGQCDRTPERVAVRFGSTALTYGELEARANRIAHMLRGRGVHRGSLVGLALNRGTDMLAALLGVLKAGAGYVPLDPQFPSERLAYMVADAGLAALVTTSEHAAHFDLRGRPVLKLDELAGELSVISPMRIGRDAASARSTDIAYVVYTSGSTGRPKGVMVPHHAVANFVAGMRREPGLVGSDRMLAVTTLSFDIAVMELLLPLCVGAEVVVADHDVVADGAALCALLRSCKATVMQATPSTWRMLLESGWKGDAGLTALCGGEALPPDLAAKLLPRCRALWNLYGPTETTVWSTVARVLPGDGPDIHIGRPTANTRIWILDPHGELCPLGVPGEIHIGGDSVTLGYLGRPDITNERFVPDRFSASKRRPSDVGVRAPLLYRTGDRGRWRADGNLEYLGRLDYQVKVRGFRIELGEIEANIAMCDGVARVLVVVREDQAGDQRLVAYLVAKPGERIDEAAVRVRLRGVLPVYMVPQHFVVLDAIPLLPNGKVDRKALPAPTGRTPESEAVHGRSHGVPERDPRVRYLITVWSDMLGVAACEDDNFFELGGHSMLAVQMINRVQSETGGRIKLIRLGAETLGQVAADLPVLAGEGAAAPSVGSRIGQGLRRLFGFPAVGPEQGSDDFRETGQ